MAALSAATACGPEEDTATGSGASSQPSAKPSTGKGGSGGNSGGSADNGGGDCGQPPKLPAGHKMIEVAAPPSKGSMTAKDAKPACTPNDWIYHGDGKANYYLFSENVKAELATGAGSTKTVPVGELWTHAGDCMTNSSAVKSPYSCSGNIYDITLDPEGKVKTIKEIWHP
ncbi:hypothetical protein [Streptomyces telluris]|uniref:Uncharacterized protein n=1 Tax=Streptomyces telluris TaxID=2720021 RepID=A0A9X2LC45_9ACTN|nr:hypothetical protein [Streptomyces telluris]MCQ8768561.1 hypothetical protein [Streptomyces telluris]NJP77181.1 hypothetical protein [Streptomyces telluris]